MSDSVLKSGAMTPIKNVPNWICRHCKHPWPITNLDAIADLELRPKQCPNRKCRAMDWDREKIKIGRPSTKQPGRPKGRGKKRVKG